MAKLKTYSEFLNEGIMDVLKSPIKYVKIRNNAKKLVKAKVAVALNDVNFEKKKQKSTIKDPDKNAVLTKANAAKNDALKDTAKGVSDRMDDLATSPILKKVSSLAKTKAAVAANKTILKSATGEEAKQLKVRQTELNKKATKLAGGIKDFESTAAKKEETKPAPTTTEKPAKTGKDGTEDKEKAKIAKDAVLDEIGKAKIAYDAVKDGDDETAKLQAEIKFKLAQQKKAKLEGNDEVFKGLADDITELKKKTPKDDPSAKLEADIKSFNDNIEAERTTMNKATKELEQAQRDLKTGRGSEEKVQKLQKAIEDSKEDIAELKKKEAEAKKKLTALPESFEYVAESVSDKFARLRSNL